MGKGKEPVSNPFVKNSNGETPRLPSLGKKASGVKRETGTLVLDFQEEPALPQTWRLGHSCGWCQDVTPTGLCYFLVKSPPHCPQQTLYTEGPRAKSGSKACVVLLEFIISS